MRKEVHQLHSPLFLSFILGIWKFLLLEIVVTLVFSMSYVVWLLNSGPFPKPKVLHFITWFTEAFLLLLLLLLSLFFIILTNLSSLLQTLVHLPW